VSISNEEELISLIYEVQYSNILQIGASDPASVFPLLVDIEYEEPFYQVIKILSTKHPQYQRLKFTRQHYTTVAEYLTSFLEQP